MKFQDATRTTVRPLIGLFGKSGGGKTMTALLFARGYVGLTGKIGLIDTETGRGSLFSDQIPGGYKVLDLDPPFSPERYTQALDAMEGLDIGIIDSTTHEWNGEGGYLDMKEAALTRMAGDDWKKREKCAMAAAAQCKPKHNRFVQHMLRMKIPLILCFRGQDKVHVQKDANGRQEIKTDDFASPIQDSGLIFEMLIAGEVFAFDDNPSVGGFFRPTKITHPDIRELLPQHNEQLGIKHGEALARWASNPGAGKPGPQKAQNPVDQLGDLKKKVWAKAKNDFDDLKSFENYLRERDLLAPTEGLATLDLAGMTAVAKHMEIPV